MTVCGNAGRRVNAPTERMAKKERAARRKPRRPLLVGLALLCAAGAAASLPLEARSLEQAERDAVLRATGYVADAIEPVVGGRASVTPLQGSEASVLTTRIERATRGADVSAARLWSLGGTLLFSTAGDAAARADAPSQVRAAAGGSVESVVAEDGTVLQTFVPMPTGGDPVAVAQIDQPYEAIAAPATDLWHTVRLGAGGSAALFAALLLLSMARRGRRTRPVGEEAPASEGAPAGDAPEPKRRLRIGPKARAAAAAGGFGTAGSARPARREDVSDDTLRKRLQKSEEARAALEEQLAQLRTQVAGEEVRNEERTHALTEQVADATARTKELEAMLGATGTEPGNAESGSPFARAAVEASADERIRALEGEVAEATAELEQARERLAELEPLVAHSAARVEDAEARASQKAKDAEVRSKEAQGQADEQARRVEAAESRVHELEAYAKDAEQRMAAALDASRAASSRIRELEGQLEGARHDQEALRRRLETLEASGSPQPEGGEPDRAADGARQVDELQSRLAEMEGRTAELEDLARAAEERATVARAEADEATRVNASLEREVKELRRSVGASDASDGTSDASDGTRPSSELEAELHEAHKAGIEAFRLAGEAKKALESTLRELDAERAKTAELEQRFAAAIGEAPAADPVAPADDAPGSGGESVGDDADAVSEPPLEGDDGASVEDDGEGDPEDGPSLRFRLARSAAQRKGRKDPDQEPTGMWTSSGRRT